MPIVSILDSYWNFCTTKIAVIDPNQQFGGIMQAQDWPATPPVEGALYLSVLAGVPIESTLSSQSQNMYEFTVQWTWYFQGNNIAGYQQAANRGDKYRRSMQVVSNIRNGNYPGFCYKTNFSADAQGNIIQEQINAAIYGGAEAIRWTKPRFNSSSDTKSGLMYQTATVRVYGIDDILPAIE